MCTCNDYTGCDNCGYCCQGTPSKSQFISEEQFKTWKDGAKQNWQTYKLDLLASNDWDTFLKHYLGTRLMELFEHPQDLE